VLLFISAYFSGSETGMIPFSNKKIPFSEEDSIKTCNSPYACSKMAMELFAKTYYQLYGISNIGLRFCCK
jgi:nucleoside-diphosphate-sugar epimerase